MTQNYGFVILSYNHPEITQQAVESLLQKGLNPQDILLFHNGSEKKWVQLLKDKFSEIQHEVIDQNRGYSGGANEALERAFKKWDWVFFLTNDTRLIHFSPPTPLWPGLYAPPIWNRKHEKLDSWGGYLLLPQARLRHARSGQDRPLKNEFFYVPGTAFLIHKNFFSHQKFDESLNTFWEDVDLSIRALREGDVVSRTSIFEVLHLGGKTCHKSSNYTLYLFQRNRWIVSFRQAPFLQKISLAFYFFKENLRILFKLLFQARWDDLRNYLRGQKEFLMMMRI